MTEQRPKVGVGVVIIKDEMTLLTKRKSPLGDGTWGSIGGHVEFGESLVEAVQREAMEELGIEIGNLTFAACMNILRDGMHYVDVSFIGEIISGEPAICEPDKIESVGWYPLSDLPSPLFEPVEAVLEGLKTGQKYFEFKK